MSSVTEVDPWKPAHFSPRLLLGAGGPWGYGPSRGLHGPTGSLLCPGHSGPCCLSPGDNSGVPGRQRRALSSQSLTDTRDLWWSDIESKFLDLRLRELSSRRRRTGRGPGSEGRGQDGVHRQTLSCSVSVLLFLSLQGASDCTCLSPVAPADLTCPPMLPGTAQAREALPHCPGGLPRCGHSSHRTPLLTKHFLAQVSP